MAILNSRKKVIAKDLAKQLSQKWSPQKAKNYLERGLKSELTEENKLKLTKTCSEPNLDVGIWTPVLKNGEINFIRKATGRDSWPGAWCDLEEIRPKRCKRVILIGESVARGLHYDPFFTPAKALEFILSSTPNCCEMEVIDLARTDGSIDYVLNILPASFQLEPDLILIFSGNNWKPNLIRYNSEDENEHQNLIFKKKNAFEIREFKNRKLEKAVNSYIELVDKCTKLSNVPILHILPEFNLVDWSPPSLSVCPSLPGNLNKRWIKNLKQITNAQNNGDFDKVEIGARKLHDLDRGLTATGPYILGHLLIKQGRIDEARKWLEIAADSANVPRCSILVQNILRKAVKDKRIIMVDLPKYFNKYNRGKLPDRELFLDYCHLTIKGINLSMSLVASKVYPLINPKSKKIDLALFSKQLATDNYIEACGSFCGALYNGRFHQKYHIIKYHIQTALELSLLIQEDILYFLKHNTSFQSKGLIKGFINNMGKPLHKIQRRLSIPKANWITIRAIKDTLTKKNPNISVLIDEIIKEEHDVTQPGGKDVLNSHFWTRFGQIHKSEGIFCFCIKPEIIIEFYAGKSVALNLNITLRVENKEVSEKKVIVVKVNKFQLLEANAECTWQTIDLTIPANSLQLGVNELIIIWPKEFISKIKTSHVQVWGSIYAVKITPIG